MSVPMALEHLCHCQRVNQFTCGQYVASGSPCCACVASGHVTAVPPKSVMNVTGLSNQASDLPAKRLELLREVLPGLRRLAVMANADYSGGVTGREQIDAAARAFGLELRFRSNFARSSAAISLAKA